MVRCEMCGKELLDESGICQICSTQEHQSLLENLFSDAITHLVKKTDTNNKNFNSYLTIANYYRMSGRFDEAQVCYQHIIDKGLVMPEVYRSLGTTLVAKEQYSKSVDFFARAVEMASGYADYHSDFGAALYKTGQYEKSSDCFHQAIKLNPKYANAYNNLSLALRKQSKYAEAQVYLKKAIELDPAHAIGSYDLGLSYYAGGMFSQIKQEFKLSAKVLGDVYAHMEEYMKASEHYRIALDLHPNYPDYHYAFGKTLLGLNREAEALSSFKKALELNPHFEVAKKELEKLNHVSKGDISESA